MNYYIPYIEYMYMATPVYVVECPLHVQTCPHETLTNR